MDETINNTNFISFNYTGDKDTYLKKIYDKSGNFFIVHFLYLLYIIHNNEQNIHDLHNNIINKLLDNFKQEYAKILIDGYIYNNFIDTIIQTKLKSECKTAIQKGGALVPKNIKNIIKILNEYDDQLSYKYDDQLHYKLDDLNKLLKLIIKKIKYNSTNRLLYSDRSYILLPTIFKLKLEELEELEELNLSIADNDYSKYWMLDTDISYDLKTNAEEIKKRYEIFTNITVDSYLKQSILYLFEYTINDPQYDNVSLFVNDSLFVKDITMLYQLSKDTDIDTLKPNFNEITKLLITLNNNRDNTSVPNTFKIKVIKELETYTKNVTEKYTESLKAKGDERLPKTNTLNIQQLDFSYHLIKYKKIKKENIPIIDDITTLNINKFLTIKFQIDNAKIQELLLVFYYYQKYDTSLLIHLTNTDTKLILERLVDYIYTKLTNPNISYLVNYTIDELLILLYITLNIENIILTNNSVNFDRIYYENKENIKIDIFYNSLYNKLKNNINLYKLVNYIFNNNIINNCYKLYLSNILSFDKYIKEYLKPILENIKKTNNNNLRLIISFENYLHLLILSNYNSDLKELLEVKDNINLKIKDLLSLLNLFYIYNNGDIKILEDKLITLLNDKDLINKYKIIKNTNLNNYTNIAANIAIIKENKSNYINILLYNHNEIESYDKSLIESNKPTIVSVIPIKQEYNEILTIFKTNDDCKNHYYNLKSINDTDRQTIDDIIKLDKIDKNIGFCNPCNVCYRNAVFTFIKYIPYIIEQLKEVTEITDFLTYPDYNNTVKFYNLLFKLAEDDNILINMLSKPTTQEDSYEFLLKIFDLLKNKLNKNIHNTYENINDTNIKYYYQVNTKLFTYDNELNFANIVFDYYINFDSADKNNNIVSNNIFSNDIIIYAPLPLNEDIIISNYESIKINDNNYILNSFICREGLYETSGHYYNIVKDKNDKWYKIDDSKDPEDITSQIHDNIKKFHLLYYTKTTNKSFNHDYKDNINNIFIEFKKNYENFDIDKNSLYINIHDNTLKKYIHNYINDIIDENKRNELKKYINSYCLYLKDLFNKKSNILLINNLEQYIADYFIDYNTDLLYKITVIDHHYKIIITNINYIIEILSINISLPEDNLSITGIITKNNIYELYNTIISNYIDTNPNLSDENDKYTIKNIILYHFIYLLKLLYIPEIDNINIISGNYIQDDNNIIITNKYIDILCIFNDNNQYNYSNNIAINKYSDKYYKLLSFCNNYYTNVNNNIYTNIFSNWKIIKDREKLYNINDKYAILFTLYNIYDNTKIIKILAHDFFGNNVHDNKYISDNITNNSDIIINVKLKILEQTIVDNPDIIIGSFNSDYEYYKNTTKAIHDNIKTLYKINISNQTTIDRYKEINNCQFEYLEKHKYKALCDTLCFQTEYEGKHTTINETSEDVIYILPDKIEEKSFEILDFIKDNSATNNFLSTTLKFKKQDQQLTGGKNKNDISLSEVFKYYYNNKTEEFNNIYKLYFILNIYSYYNNKILDITKNLKDIYNETKEIYRKYIEDFNKNSNCFIKNYYINREELEDYLNFNFIYPIYENIEKEPINIKIKINNSKIKIKKTSKEIEEEIEEFIKNKDYKIFNNSIEFKMKYQNKSYREDISYFINFIKYYTHYQKINEIIQINNINDLLSLIVLEFISNSRKIIKLNINNNNYTIQNIKVHPYKTYNNYNGKVLITLSEIEETLFLRLLRTPRNRGLYALLAHDYYYLDFDLRKSSEYLYYINEEIEEIIKDIKFEPEKREIINFNFYHFMPLETIKNLRIINDNTKLKFIINYGILLISTLYTSITLYNFISLIYIYLALNKYKKDLEEYNFNIIELLRTVIIAFKIKLKKEIDINSFILKIVNFKENPFINNLKINIKIDINILIKLLKNNKDNDEINYEDLYKSLKYIIDNYIITKYDEIVIKLQYSFILPILKELILRTDINTISIQEEIIKIKAYELLLKIDKYKEIKGGDTISDITDVITQRGTTTDIQKKTTTKESDEIKKSTDTTPNINKMIKDIEIIGKIEQLINTLDINSLEEKYYNKLKEFTFIPNVKKDNAKSELFVFDTATILGNLKLNFDDPNFLTDLNKISTLIETNLKNIQDEIRLYSEESQKTKGSTEQQLITKIKDEITKLKGVIESLAEYKEINNGDVKQLLKDFKIIIDEKEYINLIGNPKSIVDDFEEYILQIENIINTYRNILKDINNTYESIKKGLEEIKSAYKEKLRNPTANDRNLQRRLRVQEKEDEEDEEKKKGGGKLDEFEAKIKQTQADEKKPISFDELKKLFNTEDKEKLKNIKDKINDIKTHYKKLKTSNLVTDSIDKEEVLNNFVDKNGVNLFEKMLYQYDTDLKDSTEEIAKNNFYNNLENNDLDPEKQLAVTIYDKLIFIIVILVLRLLVLQVVYYFIDIDIVVNIKKAIYYYAIAYTIIFFILVFVVNVDVFRLRIVFNYINMHVNSTSIFGHIFINIIISYLIYLLILNMNSDPVRTKLSKTEKIKLKIKVDVLTITLGIFMIIITLVI